MNKPPKTGINVDNRTVDSFADEWSLHYNQAELTTNELREMFENYFRIFPWETASELSLRL